MKDNEVNKDMIQAPDTESPAVEAATQAGTPGKSARRRRGRPRRSQKMAADATNGAMAAENEAGKLEQQGEATVDGMLQEASDNSAEARKRVSKTDRGIAEAPDYDKIRAESGWQDVRSAAKSAMQRREKYVSDKENTALILARLNEIRATRMIVQGTLTAIEQKSTEICGILFYLGIKVIIPYSEMTCDSMVISQNETQENILVRQRQLISKMFGATIDFVIMDYFTGTDNSDIVALGSRKEALLRMQSRNYVANGGRPQAAIIKGGTYTANVLAVGHTSIRVNLGGVDTTIPIYNLTNRFVDDVQDLYQAGQKIQVTVFDIAKAKNGEGLSVSVSAKAAETSEMLANVRFVAERSLYVARVTNIFTTNKTVPEYRLYLPEVEVVARARKVKFDTFRIQSTIRQGDAVIFRVDKIYEEQGVIVGTIVKWLCDKETYRQTHLT